MLRHIWTLMALLLLLTTLVFAGEITFTASSDIAEGAVLFFDYTTESGTTQALSLPTATSTAAGAITYSLSAEKRKCRRFSIAPECVRIKRCVSSCIGKRKPFSIRMPHGYPWHTRKGFWLLTEMSKISNFRH